jgi:hypothetical protein
MSRAVPPRPGPEPGAPGEDDLGGLIRESLRRDVEGAPVDAARLVHGARAGAARIRQRRRTAVGSLAVLVVAVPTAVLGVRMLRSGDEAVTAASSASSASQGGAADDGRVAAPEAAGGSEAAVAGGISPAAGGAKGGAMGGSPAAAGAASPGPAALPSPRSAVTAPTTSGAPLEPSPFSGQGTPAPRASVSASSTTSSPSDASRSAALPRTVPIGAVLIAADLPRVALTRTSDTGSSRSVPATAAADTCGRPLTGLPAAAAAARAVVYERRVGPSTGWWLLASAVRVYPGAGSSAYLQAVAALPCAAAAPAGVGDGVVVTKGQVDSRGRTHWYGVVRVGRAVSEVRLVVPRGGNATAADLERLLRVAAGRLASSGIS